LIAPLLSFPEILAIKNSMTFYDASYVWLAKELNAQFVTEDDKLRQRAKGIVKTLSINELIS
ncbi:MAG: type II toxin-antitoxin system VapC family toxin, partial [Nitrososphaeria archaeon]